MTKNILEILKQTEKCDQIWNSLKELGATREFEGEWRDYYSEDIRKDIVLKALLAFEKNIKKVIDDSIKALGVSSNSINGALYWVENTYGKVKCDK